MGKNIEAKSRQNSRGFTLIAALLLTVLLSAVAVGILSLVTNEVRMGGNDLEDNLANYGAQAGIEDLTYQLANLYQTSQNPTPASITALTNSANWPTNISGSNITNMQYSESITWPSTKPNGTACPNPQNLSPTPPCSSWDIVGAGQDQGMVASMIPYTLNVTATRLASVGQVATNSAITPTGAQVNLTRTVEVALLPAFEFGIFCDGDCDYFAGPVFNFGGRVHTNGNLYLASGAQLIFNDKIAAVGEIVLDRLENNHLTSSGYTGQVYAPNASGGCPPAGTATCPQLTTGSWAGGIPTGAGGATSSNWNNGYNGFVINGTSGATKLQLPFVQSPGAVGSIDIIRRPTPGDSPLLLNSRLYSMAQIRILLSDTEADLHPDRPTLNGDPDDIQLGTPATGYAALTVSGPAGGATSGADMYYATAQQGSGNWLPSTATATVATVPTGCSSTTTTWPLHGEVTTSNPCQAAWLRVEYCPATSSPDCVGNPTAWVGVTREWLGFGFGRTYNMPPTHPYNASTVTAPVCPPGAYPQYPTGQCQNPISPAILILQQLKNNIGAGSATGSGAQQSWLPINFYDSREGEPRDTRSQSGASTTACSLAGVMNVVELDAGNLWLWLQGAAPYTGFSGNKVGQSGTGGGGFILYFSDHRGMVPDQYPLTTFYAPGFSGMSGLNDVVNSGSSAGVPDNALETATYYSFSPEDVAEKFLILNTNVLDRWGEKYLGAGFGQTGATETQPYYIKGVTNGIACQGAVGSAEWNMVTGPRHGLRLVDGGMDSAGNSYLPHPSAGNTGDGFTVASEEPVYVWGDYNTGSSDPYWTNGTATTPHSAAAIIADAVTLLSNPPTTVNQPVVKTGWTDLESFQLPFCVVSTGSPPANCPTNSGRPGNNSYYRVAIASGKSIPFPQPSWGGQDFGTDGGMHNFLRYLEDRSVTINGTGNGGTVNYLGSMISMYYSQYATGVFKCCSSVYSAPKRNYYFDTQFLNPNNLPPGTPMFQDVVSLGYHQSFVPQ